MKLLLSFQRILTHVYRILLQDCNGFTEFQDFIKFIVSAPVRTLKNNKYIFNKIKKIIEPNISKHVNRILLHCNGFTEIQDIIKLIAHSPESTVQNAKYTAKLI